MLVATVSQNILVTLFSFLRMRSNILFSSASSLPLSGLSLDSPPSSKAPYFFLAHYYDMMGSLRPSPCPLRHHQPVGLYRQGRRNRPSLLAHALRFYKDSHSKLPLQYHSTPVYNIGVSRPRSPPRPPSSPAASGEGARGKRSTRSRVYILAKRREAFLPPRSEY